MNWKKDKTNIMQFAKYNMVGVMNTVVDFLVYQMLTYLGVNYAAAQCVSYSCGVLNSFFFNSRWTFRAGAGIKSREFPAFVGVNLISLGASVGLLKICYDVLNIQSDLVSKIIVTPIAMIINFLGTKLFVFKK